MDLRLTLAVLSLIMASVRGICPTGSKGALGGFTEVDPNNKEAKPAIDLVLNKLEEEYCGYELRCALVKRQVVAGLNYCITLSIAIPKDKGFTYAICEAKVYQDLKGNVTLSNGDCDKLTCVTYIECKK